jgi:VanZ family protein
MNRRGSADGSRMQHPLRTVVRLATISLGLAIVVVSLLPQPPVSESVLGDKVEHVLAYLVLAFLVFASQLPGPRLRLLAVAVGGSVVLGGLIELIQPLTGRHAELGDLLADLVGSVAGALLALAVAHWLRSMVLRQSNRR